MGSIYIYNRKGGKCVQLNSRRIKQDDINRLKTTLPTNLEGLSFESPLDKFEEGTLSEIRVEDQRGRVAEYLKGIGIKLEQLQQMPGAVRFYDLAFRVSGNSDYLIPKARTLVQAGYVDKAERLLKRYTKDHPESPEPHFMFGKHALSRADYQKAKLHFEEALRHIRPNNVEHTNLEVALEAYLRFVSIYLDRDQIFSRDLPNHKCLEEIKQLQTRTRTLTEDIRKKKIHELDGMIFFLETQDKVFEKWLEEMQS